MNRREFLESTSAATLVLSARGQRGESRPPRPDALTEGFATPPDWAKPWVYWWWLNGFVSRDGIIRDLDAMKHEGIAGVLVFNASGGPTPKTTVFMSPEWRDLFRFAVEEASKRDIIVSLNLCSGWNAGGPWISAEEAPQTLVFSSVQVQGPQSFTGVLPQPKHDDPHYREVAVLAYRLDARPLAGTPSENPAGVCRSDSTRDISEQMQHDGHLTWEVPEGTWLILRFGHTVQMPLPRAYIKECGPLDKGFEIDPLRPGMMDKHFAATAGKIIPDVKPWLGKTLKYFHIDSGELGNPNWTPDFRAEFQRRRGYDLWPYLAALADEMVDNAEVTGRFREDFDQTLGDLTVENYYGRLAELSHQYGVGSHPESEGYQKPCQDSLRALGKSDIPMGEYWSRQAAPEGYIHQLSPAQLRWHDSIKEAASAAHSYGLPIVQAEAFTVLPNIDWSEFPFALKDIGDRAFCAGLNRNVLCFYVHQPDAEAVPGYEWPRCGLKIDRHVTWWPLSHAWLRYLARCQFLFRRGRFVADVCYFYGEQAPNYVAAKTAMTPPLPQGFDCDSINSEVLLNRLAVENGRLRLPGGFEYRLLVLPHRPWSPPPAAIFASDQNLYPGTGNGLPVGVSAQVLQKIKQLVQDGATVLGPKPVRAPGLGGYPYNDAVVRKLADELWGEATDGRSGERRLGKGRVIWGQRIEDIFAAQELVPDFNFRSTQWASKLDYIHYTLEGTEIYFISNQNLRTEQVECEFRVSHLQPELWDAVTGEIRDLPDYRSDHAKTTIPLEFAPRQSFFVIFRQPASSAAAKRGANFPAMEVVGELDGPWDLSFDPHWGGPEQIRFDRLEDWTQRQEEGIRYYSGVAKYQRSFDIPQPALGRRLFLDLGVVNYVAAVRLNGKDLGVVWTAPWHVEITQAVRPVGNTLEIEVVNLWPNRLIGDAALPPEKRFTKTNVVPDPGWDLLPSELLGPVRLWVL